MNIGGIGRPSRTTFGGAVASTFKMTDITFCEFKISRIAQSFFNILVNDSQ